MLSLIRTRPVRSTPGTVRLDGSVLRHESGERMRLTAEQAPGLAEAIHDALMGKCTVSAQGFTLGSRGGRVWFSHSTFPRFELTRREAADVGFKLKRVRNVRLEVVR